MTPSDKRQYAPATLRNRDPILSILDKAVPLNSLVLEIASGSGEHAIYFSRRLPSRVWLPSDAQAIAIASIQAWKDATSPSRSAESNQGTLLDPIKLDVQTSGWATSVLKHLSTLATQSPESRLPLRAVVNINMIHISPWEATLGLFEGCREVLPEGGLLYLYGPYKRDGQHTASSNLEFDQSLRSRDPRWGVRDLEAVIEVAQTYQFHFQKAISMPANNLSVFFRLGMSG